VFVDAHVRVPGLPVLVSTHTPSVQKTQPLLATQASQLFRNSAHVATATFHGIAAASPRASGGPATSEAAAAATATTANTAAATAAAALIVANFRFKFPLSNMISNRYFQ